MFPLEEGTKFLALLIAAQLHCLHTLLLILGRETEGTRMGELDTPRPADIQAPLRPWSHSARASLGQRGTPGCQSITKMRNSDPGKPVLAGGTPSRLTVHKKYEAYSPEMGSRADSMCLRR